jgi:hypothetical protein
MTRLGNFLVAQCCLRTYSDWSGIRRLEAQLSLAKTGVEGGFESLALINWPYS